MKKILLLLLTGIIAFTSCKKDDGTSPFTPGENNKDHPVIWTYNYGQSQTDANTIPAMDENGNIFFSIQDGEEPKTVYAFGIDKSGNPLWNKEYSGVNYCQITRAIYQSGKIFFYVTRADELYNIEETIICIDANSGTELWAYTPAFPSMHPIQSIAVTAEYVLIGAEWGLTNADSQELHYFDFSGNLIKSVEIENHLNPQQISVVGQNMYLASINYGVDPSKLTIMKMDLQSNSIQWEFIPTEDYDHPFFSQRSLAIDKDGKVLFIYRSEFGVETNNLYIINDNGSLNQIISSAAGNHETFDIIIDKDNNFYTASDEFGKYSSDGNSVWKFHHENSLPTAATFRTGSIIGDNGYIYHAEADGIVNSDAEGGLAWAKYKDGDFGRPGYPLLTEDGNVVVVGDQYVTCVKGDGAHIQNAPWPRVYCNNGNTSSR
jgi:hypothetical protein